MIFRGSLERDFRGGIGCQKTRKVRKGEKEKNYRDRQYNEDLKSCDPLCLVSFLKCTRKSIILSHKCLIDL